jgi:hypothetical protein
VRVEHYRMAMQDLLGGPLLEKNLALYDAKSSSG